MLFAKQKLEEKTSVGYCTATDTSSGSGHHQAASSQKLMDASSSSSAVYLLCSHPSLSPSTTTALASTDLGGVVLINITFINPKSPLVDEHACQRSVQ